MASYFVSPTGSDSNSGTSSGSAWQTITKVNSSVLAPGDIVSFQGGQTFSGSLSPNESGTSSNPIVFTTYGTGFATISGGIFLLSVNYVTFRNLRTVSGQGFAGSASGTGANNIIIEDFEVNGGTIGVHSVNAGDNFWTVRRGTVSNTADSGMIFESDDYTVEDCVIDNTGNSVVSFNHHGIYAKGRRERIRRCEISNWQTEAISKRGRDGIIEDNYIHDGPYGIAYYNYDHLTQRGRSVIRRNRFHNVGHGGSDNAGNPWTGGHAIYISPIGGGGGFASAPEDWVIYSNTFSGHAQSGQALYLEPANATELVIRDNIFTGAWERMMFLSVRPATYVESHNIWHTTRTTTRHFQLGGSVYNNTTLAAWNTASGGQSTLTTSPGLSVAPTFVPQPGSIAIDSGIASVASGFTITGFFGSSPDIGAVEKFTGNAPQVFTLTNLARGIHTVTLTAVGSGGEVTDSVTFNIVGVQVPTTFTLNGLATGQHGIRLIARGIDNSIVSSSTVFYIGATEDSIINVQAENGALVVEFGVIPEGGAYSSTVIERFDTGTSTWVTAVEI